MRALLLLLPLLLALGAGGAVTPAEKFFKALETGLGGAAVAPYLATTDAPFESQTAALAKVGTITAYAEWRKTLVTKALPDANFKVSSWAHDEKRHILSITAVFAGTNTGVNPLTGGAGTGKVMETEYNYLVQLDGPAGRIVSLKKVWNDHYAMQQVGWVK